MVEAVAVAFSMAWPHEAVQDLQDGEQARGLLAAFRGDLFCCFEKYRDTLAEVCDAVLCKQDRVHMAAELSLELECRRGHGAVYKALNRGQVRIARLRWALAALPLPAWDDGRIRLAVDVSNWLRPDAATSPERLFCHCYARGKGNAQMIPGWPYSLVAALEPGRTSWVLPLDAVRLGPADDATEVTAGQVREVVTRIIAARHWHDGDPRILVIFDSGYDLTRLAWLLRDLPVEILGRLRSDRVMYFPAPPRPAGANGGLAGTGRCSGLRTRRPGQNPGSRPVPGPPGTGQRRRQPGAGCTSGWPAGPDGRTTTASCPSSRAPSSAWPSITCPATAARNRCGCGPLPPAYPLMRSTAPGRHSCAALISNTRSGSSSRSSAGRGRSCAIRPPLTAGPG